MASLFFFLCYTLAIKFIIYLFFFSVPPSIDDNEDQELTVIQDKSIRLPCEVTGDPRPQITWTKNGASGLFFYESSIHLTISCSAYYLQPK